MRDRDGDNCVDVITGIDTSFFDSEGLPTDFTGVALESPVVVIGRYQVDPDVFLDAIVVEIGGTAVQVKGEVVSNPLDDKFLLLAEDELRPHCRAADQHQVFRRRRRDWRRLRSFSERPSRLKVC